MNFAEAMTHEASHTFTENGALALNTTFDARLDLYGTIGALREADVLRVYSLFEEAYKEDPLFTMKILFYTRDIREGLGEREVFRTLINYIAKKHPEALERNLDLIAWFGRWDDMYALIATPLEAMMWAKVERQFKEDLSNMADKKPISLLGKWLKTADASSKTTRELGIYTAKRLGLSVYDYKRKVRALRKYLKIVERDMSANEWDKIEYGEVPSRAMMNYRNAFYKHDEARFGEFMNKVVKGEAKINASTLFPYDIVRKYMYPDGEVEGKEVLEAQWQSLPNYVDDTNILVMADVSGSMYGTPITISIGLAMYFAERNKGAFHDMFMTFSGNPRIQKLKGATLEQKIANLNAADWGMNTNLHAAFQEVLDMAKEYNVPAEEIPKAICVISDMEIDFCGDRDWSFYDKVRKEYTEAGYQIPNVIFWNVNSKSNVFHADNTRVGVQLASGASPTVFKQVVMNLGLTPVEAMTNVINSPRYETVSIAQG